MVRPWPDWPDQSLRAWKAFRQLGDDWTVKPGVMADVEAFTCLMYGQAQETSVM